MLETDFVLVFKAWSKLDQRMALQSSARFSLQFQFVAIYINEDLESQADIIEVSWPH